jgi:hypothetical protein
MTEASGSVAAGEQVGDEDDAYRHERRRRVDGARRRETRRRHECDPERRRRQTVSGTISIAPHGHSATQIPQPLQKS